MIVADSSTMQTQPYPAALTTAAEVWSDVEGSMIRQAAAPSVGEMSQRLGQACGRVVADLVDQVCAARQPRLAAMDEQGLSVLLWPVIDRERVTAVATLYMNTGESAQLAAEVWSGRPGRSELCLGDACYSGLDRFAKLSPYISFPKGSGIPGLVWESNLPQVVGDLGNAASFMRASGAASEGLDLGFALPCIDRMSLQAVVLMLSGSTQPFARCIETWLVEQSGSLRLRLHEGAYVDAELLKQSSNPLSLPAGDTWIGRAWATRLPTVVCDSSGQALERRGATEAGLTCGLAIPIIVLDDVAAVAVMMW